MKNPDQIRAAIAKILSQSLKDNSTTYTELAEKLDVAFSTLYDAVNYGIIEATDLIILCRELDLDAEAVIETAVNSRLDDINNGDLRTRIAMREQPTEHSKT